MSARNYFWHTQYLVKVHLKQYVCFYVMWQSMLTSCTEISAITQFHTFTNPKKTYYKLMDVQPDMALFDTKILLQTTSKLTIIKCNLIYHLLSALLGLNKCIIHILQLCALAVAVSISRSFMKTCQNCQRQIQSISNYIYIYIHTHTHIQCLAPFWTCSWLKKWLVMLQNGY
jgi:hypothetical protein